MRMYSIYSTLLLLTMLWITASSIPLRHRTRKDRDTITEWDYQADVYDNRILDDVSNSREEVSKSTSLMRPQPSDEILSISKFEFPPGNSRDRLPTAKDLDPSMLLRFIGNRIDDKYLSITQPFDSLRFVNGTMESNFKKGLPKDELPEEIQHLNIALPGNEQQNMRIKNPQIRRILRQYLWASSYCPVVYKWKDLGERFWPRWINIGDCYKRASCSIPAGMTCQPSESTDLTVLWWRCRRSRCKWLPVQWPILTKCTCGC